MLCMFIMMWVLTQKATNKVKGKKDNFKVVIVHVT